jgi:hypothetical protein
LAAVAGDGGYLLLGLSQSELVSQTSEERAAVLTFGFQRSGEAGGKVMVLLPHHCVWERWLAMEENLLSKAAP